MKLVILLLMTVAALCSGQKSPYLSSSLSYPGVLPQYTSGGEGGGGGVQPESRLGEGTTTQRSSTLANLPGSLWDQDYIDVVASWPKSKQPFWYLNNRHLAQHRGYQENRRNQEQDNLGNQDNQGGFVNQNSRIPDQGGFVNQNSRVPDQGGFVNQNSRVPDQGGFVSPNSRIPDQGGFANQNSRIPDQEGFLNNWNSRDQNVGGLRFAGGGGEGPRGGWETKDGWRSGPVSPRFQF